jgi:hypothetical protein
VFLDRARLLLLIYINTTGMMNLKISFSVLLRMRNVSDKSCRGNQNTHFLFDNFFFLENRIVYEILWKSIVQPDRPQITIWRMRVACWIPITTDTQSQYVILIPFPVQHWLHERASTLRRLSRLYYVRYCPLLDSM